MTASHSIELSAPAGRVGGVLGGCLLALAGGALGLLASAAPAEAGPRAAPQGSLATTAATAAMAASTCDWLREARALQGRVLLTYHAEAGRLQQHHDADVSGRLVLVSRDAHGAVFAGPLRQGWLAVHDRWQASADGAVQLVQGHGAPSSGAAMAGSAATVRVQYAHCELQLAARLAVPARAGSAAVQAQQLGWVAARTVLAPEALAGSGAALHTVAHGQASAAAAGLQADLSLPVQGLRGDGRPVAEQAAALGSAYLPAGVLAHVPAPVAPPAGQARMRLVLSPAR